MLPGKIENFDIKNPNHIKFIVNLIKFINKIYTKNNTDI